VSLPHSASLPACLEDVQYVGGELEFIPHRTRRAETETRDITRDSAFVTEVTRMVCCDKITRR